MPPKKAEAVLDDWEAADVDEDDGETKLPTPAQQAASNARLWNEPQYTIVSSSATNAPPPPVIAQPKMQILKRPSSAASNGQERSSATPPPKSMAEREKAYQEARERIFAKKQEEEKHAIETIRQPAGPEEGIGFTKREKPTPGADLHVQCTTIVWQHVLECKAMVQCRVYRSRT